MRREASLLWLSALLATIGGVVALAGARAAWVIVRSPGRSVVVDGQSVSFPAQEEIVRVDELAGGGTTAWAALVVVLALAMFLVGPRVRFAASIGVVIAAGAVGIGLPDASIEVLPPAVAEAGAGRPMALAGSLVALMGGLAALPLALKVPRIRMPERAPDLDVSAPER